MAKEGDNAALARAMVARYGARRPSWTPRGGPWRPLGGMAYIGSPDVAYLAAACHLREFPPAVQGRDQCRAGGQLPR
ncbi:hypothetical protein LT493_06410 [Streptomyces tricolor]|nr:hypothetical protein [Streptomyces tricolor]